MTLSSHRRRLRFRFQWRAILVLAAVWVLLWGNWSVIDLLVGLALGWVVTVLFPLPPVRYHGRLHPFGALKLLGSVFRDLAVASFGLALTAFSPRPRINPGVVRVQLRGHSDLYEVQTAELLSIVPGTLVLEVRRSTRTLYLHAFDLTDPDAVEKVRADALAAERRVFEAFGSRKEIDGIRRKQP